jgi:hypothetical protein
MKYSDTMKADYWDLLASQRRPPTLTAACMAQLKVRVWDVATFWDAIIAHYGGLEMSAHALMDSQPAVFEHCLDDFHFMLVQIWRGGW